MKTFIVIFLLSHVMSEGKCFDGSGLNLVWGSTLDHLSEILAKKINICRKLSDMGHFLFHDLFLPITPLLSCYRGNKTLSLKFLISKDDLHEYYLKSDNVW